MNIFKTKKLLKGLDITVVVGLVLFSMVIFDLGSFAFLSSKFNREELVITRENTILVDTLKEILPSYTDQLLNDPELNEEQRTSLQLTYSPLVEDFINTGNTTSLDKANHLKRLILKGDLVATVKD